MFPSEKKNNPDIFNYCCHGKWKIETDFFNNLPMYMNKLNQNFNFFQLMYVWQDGILGYQNKSKYKFQLHDVGLSKPWIHMILRFPESKVFILFRVQVKGLWPVIGPFPKFFNLSWKMRSCMVQIYFIQFYILSI